MEGSCASAELENKISDMEISDNLPASRSVKEILLDNVAKSDAHFKHQQRGEPDLTYKEKYAIAEDILDKKASIFLQRFGQYLTVSDLVYFEPLKGDYTIDFYIKDIKKQCDDKKNEVKIRNRRYEAMNRMENEGNYFGDEEMKSRDPLLYEQMVGQYLTEDEIHDQVADKDLSLSAVMMQHLDMQANNRLFEQQRDVEEGQVEEVDSDEDEEEEELVDEDENIHAGDKLMMREEFLRTMKLRFLAGEDKDFDYSTVDSNVEYDCLQVRSLDEEEKYFDEDDTDSQASSDRIQTMEIQIESSDPGTLSNKEDKCMCDDERTTSAMQNENFSASMGEQGVDGAAYKKRAENLQEQNVYSNSIPP